MNGSYRVTPHPATIPPEEVIPNNRLMCGQYPGLLTHEVAPFTWYIRLYNDCPDVGMAGGVPGSDGTLDNNDFIAFISLFFQHSERADFGSAGGLPGSDGLFDNNDFIAFIDLYFAGANSEWLAQHCENVYTGCGNRPGPGGDAPAPRMSDPAPAGGVRGRVNDTGAPGQDGLTLDIFADLRAILEQRLAAETDPARAAQIQEMLNSLPQP